MSVRTSKPSYLSIWAKIEPMPLKYLEIKSSQTTKLLNKKKPSKPITALTTILPSKIMKPQ